MIISHYHNTYTDPLNPTKSHIYDTRYCAFKANRQMVVRASSNGMVHDLYCAQHEQLASAKDVCSSTKPIIPNNNYNHNNSADATCPATPLGTCLNDTQELFNTDEKSGPGHGQAGYLSRTMRLGHASNNINSRPPVQKRKRLQKISEGTGNGIGISSSSCSSSGKLKLVTEKSKKLSVKMNKHERIERHRVQKFFEMEAELSGPDSGDDDTEEDGKHDTSTQLSGSFINNGDYTQHTDDEEEDANLLYYKVNHLEQFMGSDGWDRGEAGQREGERGNVRSKRGITAHVPPTFSPSPLKFGFRGTCYIQAVRALGGFSKQLD